MQQKKTFVRLQSIIDKDNEIDRDNWVVAIGRKMEGRTKNTEHAFLLIEGIDKNAQVFLGKYEFGVTEKGLGIVITNEDNTTPSEIQDKFKDILWHKTPANVIASLKYSEDGWYKKSWSITSEQAQQLITDVEKDRLNPPPYAVIGSDSISGSSNSGSSKKGHNCYTWTRQKLRNLEDSRITKDADIDTSWTDRLVAITSKHIGPEEKSKSLGGLVSQAFGW